MPASPAIDANSQSIVSWLSGGAHPGVVNLYEYGVPIWEADAGTPRHAINCVRSWGVCGLEKERVPIPHEAFAATGSDGAMVVVDWSTGKSFEFWEAKKVSGAWQAGWGGVLSTSGDGIGTPTNHGVGSGLSRLAGVVRTYEMVAGRIDHALVFSTNNACRGAYRAPASKTDGRSSRSDCIPEGARVQLDPSIDIDAIAGLSSGERTVARALQEYGAYAIDNGGANMAFIFEVPSGESDPYPSVGFTQDYQGLDKIPWSSLRVLRQWDGG